MFVLKQPRTSQPDGPVGIDWSNPVTRGLVMADNPTVGFNEVDGEKPYWQTTRRIPSGAGIAYSNEGSSLLDHDYPGNAPSLSGDSSIFIFATAAGAGVGNVLAAYDNAVGSEGIELSPDASSVPGAWLGSGNSWSNFTFGSVAIPVGVAAPWLVTHDNANGALVGYFRHGVFPVSGVSGIGARDTLVTGAFVQAAGGYGGRSAARVGLILVWDRLLANDEALSIVDNPWQVFAPRRTLLSPSGISVQYARPSSDVAAGTWTASAGGSLYAMLDEAVANDADYIFTSSGSTCEVALSSVSDPASSADHIVRYRLSASAGGITVRLRHGTTTIASWAHNPAPMSPTTYEHTLSGAEADSITDYGALKLQFEATP